MWGNWVMKNRHVRGLRARLNYRRRSTRHSPRNHVELTDAYDKPVIDWLPLALVSRRREALRAPSYRVHIGPPPNGSADPNEWNMKAIGAFAATDMLQHYY